MKDEPFCMVSFIGNLTVEQVRLRLTMMSYVAAVRFDRQPCSCEGCQEFTAELVRYGTRQG